MSNFFPLPQPVARLDSNWRELEPYGINYLTGEADRYGERVLCDLSVAGVDLLQTYFGGTITFTSESNWNSRVGDAPAIASVLLPRDLLFPLFRFILFHVHQVQVIVKAGDCHYGFNDMSWQSFFDEKIMKLYRNPTGGDGGGDRHVHAMSGRWV